MINSEREKYKKKYHGNLEDGKFGKIQKCKGKSQKMGNAQG